MADDRKNSRLESATNVLQKLLQNGRSPLSHQFTRWRLWRYWPDVVGPSLAPYTTPVDYEKGRLVIWVSDSVRLQEITFITKALRDRINEFVGRRWVTHIRYTLDRHSVPKRDEMDPSSNDYLK